MLLINNLFIILLICLFSNQVFSKPKKIQIKARNAILNGVSALNTSNDTNIIATIYPLILMLNDSYNLAIENKGLGIHNKYIKYNEYNLIGFYRMLDNNFVFDTSILNKYSRDDLNYLMFKSFNCDNIPLDSNYLNEVNNFIKLGNYELTHAILCLGWAENKKCVINSDSLQEIKENNFILLSQIVMNKKKYSIDLRYEALAILFHIYKDENNIKRYKKYVKEIINVQLESGFYPKVEGDFSVEHTTILATWALCEWLYSDKVVVAW